LDLKLGLSNKVCRFMVDNSAPFTMILETWASSLRASAVFGTNPPQVTFGSAQLGDLDCGEFRAVPVVMSLPPDCCGVLSTDFLKRFNWEFDVGGGKVKVARVSPANEEQQPFNVEGLTKVPLEWRKAMNVKLGMEFELLCAPAKIGRQGIAVAAEALLGSLGKFSVACHAYFFFGSVTACSTDIASALALGSEDYPGTGRSIKTPGGMVQTFQDYALSVVIGDGPGGTAQIDTQVCVDHPALRNFNFMPGTPALVVGLDVLKRSRIVLSLQLGCLWIGCSS